MTIWRYAIGLGSNRPHGTFGDPASVIRAAEGALAARDVWMKRCSRVIRTAPLGPSLRRYANAAAIVETTLSPASLLAVLKEIEHAFGRRRGQRWGARVIDLDILLWSGGAWHERRLTIPHSQLAWRSFVLDPLAEIAPEWRLPGSAVRVRHLAARLNRSRPMRG